MEYISYNGKTKTTNRHETKHDALSHLSKQLDGASHHELSMSYIAKIIQTSVIPTGTCDNFGMKNYTINLRYNSAASSSMIRWFCECVVRTPKMTMTVSEVHDHYIAWCIHNHESTHATKRALGTFLVEVGVSKWRTSNARIWVGISIK